MPIQNRKVGQLGRWLMTTQARTALMGGALSKRMAAVTAAAVVLAFSGGLVATAQAASPDSTGTQILSGGLRTVVVTGDSVATVTQQVRSAGGEVTDELPLVNGVIARLPDGAALPGLQVTADAPLKVASKVTGAAEPGAVSTVRATLGLDETGNEGAGVTVALVDTGVAEVPDLAGKIVDHVNVTGGRDGDGYGHGTFLAGLIAGSGQASGGAYQGAAPGAKILDVRVATNDGSTSLAKVLRGLQSVARLGSKRVPVVNLSLSSGSPLPYQFDPLTVALDVMWLHGFTVVVPAGNDGTDGVASPGVDPTLITAGALNEQASSDHTDDTVSDFSGRGPAPQGVAKPDLVAPGEHLIGLRAPGSVVDSTFPDSRVGDSYFRGSGTSMATALTSAVVADVIASRRDLSPDAIKALLIESAYAAPAFDDETAAGAGGLDAAAAIGLAPTAVAPSPDDGDYLPPGDAKTWDKFAKTMLKGDFDTAARLWNKLSPQGRRWAETQWDKLSPAGRRWAQASWDGRRWAAADSGSLTKYWAALLWSGRRWAADSWNGRRWADSSWLGRRWADDDWAGRRWADDDWTGRRWSQASWDGRRWIDLNWLGRRWVDADWNADSWAGQWS